MNLFSAIAQGGLIGMGDYLASLVLVRHQPYPDGVEDVMPSLNLLTASLFGSKGTTKDKCLIVDATVSFIHYKNGNDVFEPFTRRYILCPPKGRADSIRDQIDFATKAIFNQTLREQNTLCEIDVDVTAIKVEYYCKAMLGRNPEPDNTPAI